MRGQEKRTSPPAHCALTCHTGPLVLLPNCDLHTQPNNSDPKQGVSSHCQSAAAATEGGSLRAAGSWLSARTRSLPPEKTPWRPVARAALFRRCLSAEPRRARVCERDQRRGAQGRSNTSEARGRNDRHPVAPGRDSPTAPSQRDPLLRGTRPRLLQSRCCEQGLPGRRRRKRPRQRPRDHPHPGRPRAAWARSSQRPHLWPSMRNGKKHDNFPMCASGRTFWRPLRESNISPDASLGLFNHKPQIEPATNIPVQPPAYL